MLEQICLNFYLQLWRELSFLAIAGELQELAS
jgi:hypothetical protein